MRRVGRMLTLLIVCALLAGSVAASQLTSLHTQATVQADGDCRMEIEAMLSLDEKLDTLLIPLGFEVSNVTLDGVAVDVTRDRDGFCFLPLTGGFSGVRALRVGYTIRPELRSFTTVDEQEVEHKGKILTIPLIPGRWSWPIAAFQFHVTLPSPLEELEPTFESGYLQDVIGDYMVQRQTESSFSGALSETMRDRETLSVSVKLPEHYFGAAARRRAARKLPVFQMLAGIFWVLGLLYWLLKLRMRQDRIRRRTMPPDGASAGLLPTLLYGATPDAAGILMNWCALGYVTIRKRKRVVTLCRQMAMGNERPAFEMNFFNALFAGGDTCGAGRFLTLGAQLEDRAAKAWNRRILDKKSGNPRITQVLMGLGCACAAVTGYYAAFGMTLLAVVGLVLGFAAGMGLPRGIRHAHRRQWSDAVAWIGVPLAVLLAPVFFGGGLFLLLAAAVQAVTGLLLLWGPRRSRAGMELLEQARGLDRDFAKLDRKQLRKRLREDGQYFYTMLPYAIALGRGKRFMKLCGSTILDPCGWLEGSRSCYADAFCKQYRLILDVVTGIP